MAVSTTSLNAETSHGFGGVLTHTHNPITPPELSATSFLSRDYWKEALELLDPAQRGSLERACESHISSSTCESDLVSDTVDVCNVDEWPAVLLDICQKLRKEYDNKKSTWCFRIPGRRIKIRDLIDGFIKLFEKTKKIGDLASAADPVHAGLPWAVVRTLLMVVIPLYLHSDLSDYSANIHRSQRQTLSRQAPCMRVSRRLCVS